MTRILRMPSIRSASCGAAGCPLRTNILKQVFHTHAGQAPSGSYPLLRSWHNTYTG
jgi:hypothetical protein